MTPPMVARFHGVHTPQKGGSSSHASLHQTTMSSLNSLDIASSQCKQHLALFADRYGQLSGTPSSSANYVSTMPASQPTQH